LQQKIPAFDRVGIREPRWELTRNAVHRPDVESLMVKMPQVFKSFRTYKTFAPARLLAPQAFRAQCVRTQGSQCESRWDSA
jgi:hypothetical protein